MLRQRMRRDGIRAVPLVQLRVTVDAKEGPNVPLTAPLRDSEPPKSVNEFPGLEHLERPELDEDWEDWEDKSGVLRKTHAYRLADTRSLPRSA